MKTYFKKIVVVMAVICVLFAMFALAASATEEVPLGGEFTSKEKDWQNVVRDQYYKWNYDTDTATLTIEGKDNTYNWLFQTLANNTEYGLFVNKYGAAVKTINITGTIHKMAGNVIALGCPNVETLNFVANNRFQAASSFFGGLASLKVVNFGDHTSDCVDLTNISTMDQLKDTFKDCTSIEKVLLSSTNNFTTGNGGTAPENQVYYIIPSMFEDCTSLSDIEIPGWVTEIKAKAFKNCTSLTKLAIPASVTTIADDAFDGCTLTIVGAVGSAAEAFANAHDNIAFEEYDIYTAIEGRDISWYWDASTDTLHFKGTGTTIADYEEFVKWNRQNWAVYHYEPWKDIIKSVKHVEMQDCVNLTTIPGLFFSDYTALETIVFPESVTTFGNDDTFRGATSLHSIAVGSPANLVDGVLDLSRITKLSSQTFDAALSASVDYVVYFNPSASVSGGKNDKGQITGTFNTTKAKTVKMYVLSTATAVPETLVSYFPDVFSYECYTWEEYKTRWPLASDAALSGDYGCGTWNFDIDTGVFEMVCEEGSGWRQWEFNGGSNPTLKTAWSVLKMYVKEMRFTGSVGTKIWADGNFVFSNMSFLEKIALPARVDQIQLGKNSFEGNTNLKTLGETDGVVDLTLFGPHTANLTNCTSIEKIKIGQSSAFTSAMLEGLTGLSSVEFTGTDAENVAALGAASALVFASDVRIDVKSAEVKAAVEALGYTNVHGPAATVKSGMILDGYQLRNADYNGLRTVYTFNLTDAKASNPDYTLVEYGAILASSAAKNSYGTNLTQDAEGNWVTANAKVMKMAVGDSTGVINKTLDSSTNDKIKFCVAVVRYSNNYDTNLYNVGYEIWQNNETGEYSVVYTDYNTGRETTSSWAETSIYAVTLGRIKEGLEDPNNEIHWGVLTGKGAVTFTKGTDYTDEWTDMNGVAFGDTFTFLDVQAADNSGKTSGMSTFSVFEDENGKYVIIYKNGNTTYSSWDRGSQIYRYGADSESWFVKNGKAPNPYIENAKLWNKIYTIVLAENVEVPSYAFNSTRATQLTYAPGTKGFDRAFTNANYLSSIFPTNYGGATSNKVEGVFDLSEASGITDLNETFKACTTAKYIRIPATVATINDKAFNSCGSLLSVVTGDNAFADGVIDLRDSAVRKIALGNSANVPIYGGTIKVNGVDTVIDNIRTVYLPALADGETFTIGEKTFNTAINFRQATFSQAVYDFVANSGVAGMTYTDINGNVWDQASSGNYESMAGWSNIIVD